MLLASRKYLASAAIHWRAFSTSSEKTIGFIGLGVMGYPMAVNLLKKTNSNFIVCDAMQEQSSRFFNENKDKHPQINYVATPAQVASKADVIVTMLPSPSIVKEVYLGKQGVCAGIYQSKKQLLCIDSSTIDPTTARDVATEIRASGSLLFDAPVSGGFKGAQDGTLTFLVGAETENEFKRVEDVVQHMGKKVFHCGGVGTGQIAKICNNMVLGISMIGLIEAMHLGERLGMDSKLLSNIINNASGRSWSSEIYNPVPNVIATAPASREYKDGFGVKLMAKDMGLAVDAAKESNSMVLLAAASHQLYNHVSSRKGYEKLDFSSVYKWIKENSS